MSECKGASNNEEITGPSVYCFGRHCGVFSVLYFADDCYSNGGSLVRCRSGGYAMHKNSHIRVELVLSGMTTDRRAAEIICTAVSSLLAAAFAWYAIKANYVSFELAEKSQGQDEIFIWIPQLAMSIGTIVLLIALLDRLHDSLKSPQFGGHDLSDDEMRA